MLVERVEVVAGAVRGACRLAGTVRYGDGTREVLYFDFPEHSVPELNRGGDPWLVALAPLAMAIGEPLQVPQPVDATLLAGIHELAAVWRSWAPGLAPLEVQASVAPRAGPAGGKTVSLFSGGVDSWYTLVTNDAEAAAGLTPRIDALLLVAGADVPLSEPEVQGRIAAGASRVAADTGRELLQVATNLRTTRWGRTTWAEISHGAFFAAIMHAAGRFSHGLIPSSVTSDFPDAWGSHPRTDPLMSSAALRIQSHGPDVDRTAKIGRLCQSPGVVDQLRVCWRSGTDRNCGRCGKCVRTMVGLEIHGGLARCSSFPDRLDLARVAGLHAGSRPFAFRQLLASARRSGRTDLVEVLERALSRSRRLDRVGAVLDRLDNAGIRGAYRLRRWLERDVVRE